MKRQPPSPHRAFTLLELLIVMAIITALTALTVPAVVSLRDSWQMASASQSLLGMFDLARQTALARNRSVLIRLYRSGSDAPYHSFSASVIEDSGERQPLTRRQHLPAGLCLSASPEHSHPPESATGTETFADGSSALYSEFRFRRDGSTDLPASDFWYVTLLRESDLAQSEPKRFLTLLIEPTSGHLQPFQP